jgi:metal-responsive CopG/Arc/MetJ family transcriptional regulator
MPQTTTEAPTTWIGCKVRRPLIERLDDLADRGQLSRSEVIRLALKRLVEEDLPSTIVDSAAIRRTASLHTGSPADMRPA